MKNNPNDLFLYLEGLKNLVASTNGNEKIHVGIRPYGFHAGNALAVVAYPYLLCEFYEKKYKKQPEFTFFISINDWEQDALDGPDYRRYPFNIYPKETSTNRKAISVVDYWQPSIEAALRSKLKKFSNISINFVRNSDLKSSPIFEEYLMKTILNPLDQSQIFKKYSRMELLEKPIAYAGAICPLCKKSHGKTNVIDIQKKIIKWECSTCSTKIINPLKMFDYWWYHKPLLVARLKIFDIDITLSGGDHFSEGDYMIRKKMIEYFDDSIKIPRMLFTPTLLSPLNNERMSKSRNNTVYADLEKLINFARVYSGHEFRMPNEAVMNINDDEYEKYCSSL